MKDRKEALKIAKWCNRKSRDVLTYVRDAAKYKFPQPELWEKAFLQAVHLQEEIHLLEEKLVNLCRESKKEED